MRNCIFYPRKPEDDDGEPQDLPSDARISILITMSHPDGACKFLGTFKSFVSRLDDRYNMIQAFMVPANKDVPLPPPIVDEETQQHLGEKLWQNFVAAEAPELHEQQGISPAVEPKDEPQQPLDADKVAAAAGGNNYDAEEDPLNAPAVLEAVKEFRRKLTKTQSFQKRKRMELVAQKLAQMMPRIQTIVEEEKKRAPPLVPPAPPASLSLNLPPPMPMGMGMAPIGGGVPPPLPPGDIPLPSTGDSGKRGRSNLPAWMTSQEQAQDQEQNEPPSKRPKEDHPLNFPPLPPTTHAPLREFLAAQVQEALGEQEAELIHFLHSHIIGGKATAEMLQELQMVLEEEATAFLQAVWDKVREFENSV